MYRNPAHCPVLSQWKGPKTHPGRIRNVNSQPALNRNWKRPITKVQTDTEPRTLMGDLLHRIKIFLFRREGGRPTYLQLKTKQGMESLWGPLQSELGFGEKLEGAIRYHVRTDLGIMVPGQVLDLKIPSHWSFGDEDIVEWSVGYQCVGKLNQDLLAKHWSAHRWEDFSTAYATMGLEFDRQAILRLHSDLLAA